MKDEQITAEDGEEALRITIEQLEAELNRQNLNLRLTVLRLKQGLNAKIVRVFHEKGDIFYSKRLVDYETRRKYLDMLLKLRDLYPSEKHELDLSEATIKFYKHIKVEE